jgi:ketosteroid isomerase-like protein
MKLRASLLLTLTLVAGAAAQTLKPHTAARPEQQVTARHRGLIAALNRGDLKALRTFYSPDYRAEGPSGSHNLDQQISSLGQILKEGAKLNARASLEKLAVKGDTATAVEVADVTLTLPNGHVDRSRQRSQQRWKRAGGVWKLAWEKSLEIKRDPPAPRTPAKPHTTPPQP